MITGVVSEQDYVEAQRVHRQPLATKFNWALGVVTLGGLALIVLGIKPWGLMATIGGICGFIGEAIQAKVYVPAIARKHYHQFKGIETPITYRWDTDGLSVQSDRGAGERKWKDFLKVRESDQVFLLYTTDVLFEVVPKRWFGSPEQALEFGALAKGTRET